MSTNFSARKGGARPGAGRPRKASGFTIEAFRSYARYFNKPLAHVVVDECARRLVLTEWELIPVLMAWDAMGWRDKRRPGSLDKALQAAGMSPTQFVRIVLPVVAQAASSPFMYSASPVVDDWV